jgi:hypothetical protein
MYLRWLVVLAAFVPAAAADPPQISVVDLSQGGKMASAAAIDERGGSWGRGTSGRAPTRSSSRMA